jgi:hypothetical protein
MIKPGVAQAVAALAVGEWLDDGDPRGGKGRVRFTVKRRTAFFDALALTCNVEKAAAYAGIDKTTTYWHRRRDPMFAEQWREALNTGYDRLEALVLEHGGAGMALPPADPDRAIEGDTPPFDFDKAIATLRLYRSRRDAVPFNHGGRPRRNATREETNAALIKALAAARKRIARGTPGA